MKTYTYAVQWIDHGGPYHESCWDDQIPTVLEQMGFDSSKVLLEVGGFKLKGEEDDKLYGFIKTNVELPKWNGMLSGSARWADTISLWFYTWEPNVDEVQEWYDWERFDELYHS